MTTFQRTYLFGLIGGLLFCGNAGFAADTTHTLISGTGWQTADWINGVPNAAGDTANYSGSGGASLTLDSAIPGQQITIGEISNAGDGDWTINVGTASGLTLDPTGLTVNNPMGDTNAFIGTISTNPFGNGNLTINPAITLATGTTLDIACMDEYSTMSMTGGITGTGNLILANPAGGTLSISGAPINNTGNITVDSVYTVTVSANIGSNVNNLTVNGGTLQLQGTNAYTGTTTVNGGNLDVAGSLSGTSSVVVTGGSLSVSQINPLARLTLGGAGGDGGLFIGDPQTLASLTVGAGFDVINGSGAVTFTGTAAGGGYNRNLGGLMDFETNESFTNAPTAAGGSSVIGSGSTAILNGAVLNFTDFVTAKSGTVTAATYGANDTFLGGTNAVVTKSDNPGTAFDVQSLKFTSGATLTLTGTNTIDSGGIIVANGTSTIAGGTLRAGSGQDLWVMAYGQTLNINSVIADNNTSGLEVYDNGLVNLGGANTFTGQVWLDDSATLELSNASALGLGSANINFSDSSTLETGTAISTARNIVIDPGATATFNTSGGNLTLSGTISDSNPVNTSSIFIDKTGSNTLFFTGSTVDTSNLGFQITGGTFDVTGTFQSASSSVGVFGGSTSGTAAVIRVHENGVLSTGGSGNFAGTANSLLTLDIQDQGQVSLGGTASFGRAVGAVGTVNQTGGVFTAANFEIGGNGGTGSSYNLDGGVMFLKGTGTSTIDTGSTLYANGGTIEAGFSQTISRTNAEYGTAGQIVIQAGGLNFDAGTSYVTSILAPLLHSSALGSTADGGLTKTDSGKLVFVGGTYTGATTVNGGTLEEDFTQFASGSRTSGTASNNINSSSALVLGGGTLAVNGAANGTGFGPSVQGTAGYSTSGTGSIGSRTITVSSATGLAIGQSISGTGIASGTTIAGISGTTVTLSKGLTSGLSNTTVSTFGSTSVTVSSSSFVSLGASVSGTGIAAGTYVTAISGTTVFLSAPTTAYVPNGTSLTIGAVSNVATTQTFNGTTVNSGADAVALTNNGTSVTVGLAAITRNSGGTLNFGTVNTSTAIVTTSNANDATGILGDWASVGSGTSLQYAMVDGSNRLVSYNGAITASANLANVQSSTTNYTYGAAASLGAASTGNTLQYTGGSTTTDLKSFNLTLNGLMNSGAGTLTIQSSGGGQLEIGASKELVILANTQNTTINSVIADNGANSSALTYTGGSSVATLTLGAANTYSGVTTDNEGIIQINNSAALQNSTLNLSSMGGTIAFNSGLESAAFGGLSGNGNLTLTDTGSNPIALAIGNNNANTTYSGVLSGPGSLAKIGSGTTTLSGGNTDTGTTTVTGGTLRVDGSTASSSTTVGNHALLDGTGTLGAVAVSSGGTLMTGDNASTINQTLTASSLSLASNATLQFKLNTATVQSDTLAVTGQLTLDDTNLVLSDLAAKSNLLTLGTQFTLLTYGTAAGLGTGTDLFVYNGQAVQNGGLIDYGVNQFEVNYASGDPSITLTSDGEAVPEPSTWVLLSGGMSLLAFWRSRYAKLV